MGSPLNPKKVLDAEKLKTLRHLKRLLDEDFEDEDGKDRIKDAVKNILKKKSDVGEIVLGLDSVLKRLAVGLYRSGKLQAAQSALALVKGNTHG